MYHLKQIPSDAQIQKYLRRILFGKNIFCPVCRSRDIVTYETRYRCRRCRTKFSLLSHTWLADMKLSYQAFWLLLWCWTTSIPVKQAMLLTRRSEEAVRRWYDHFRAHLPEHPVVLERIVQLDEAYFRSRGLMMGKQSGTRKLAYLIAPHPYFSKYHAAAFLETYVRPRSKLQTDRAGIYRAIDQWWPVRHRTDLHRQWEFTHTAEIDGIFGNLRTFIRRMYHHVTPEKLPEYVGEFCARFSSPELFNNPLHYLKQSLVFCTN